MTKLNEMTVTECLKGTIECYQDDFGYLDDCIRLSQRLIPASEEEYLKAFDEIKDTVQYQKRGNDIVCKSKVSTLFVSEYL